MTSSNSLKENVYGPTLCLVSNLIKILSCDDDRSNLDVVNVKVDVVIGKSYYYLVRPVLVGFYLS